MKILITGTNGQVGHALMHELTEHELIGLTRQDCDLSNLDQIKQVIDQHQPDLIINPAAYTKVDQAEDEPELAYLINRDAPKIMAEKAFEYDIPFIHFSTDYVFDGKKRDGYSEGDRENPINIYGKSKLAGEDCIKKIGGKSYIFRTSWVYSYIGTNFLLKVKDLCNKKKIIKIVDDQISTPTSNLFISKQIKKIIPQLNINNTGTYHLKPHSHCSWFDFANEIVKREIPIFDLKNINSIKSIEFPTSALRPKNSKLLNRKIVETFSLDIKDWKEEFYDFLKNSNMKLKN
jgi:dTDP-4-dehydrorhamnose reductase